MKRLLFIFLCGILFSCKTKTNINALENKASKAYEKHDYVSAVKYYNQLIELDSLNGWYFFARAFSKGMQAKATEAKSDYFRCVALNYRVQNCYFYIGVLNTYTNDSLAAIYFKKAMDAQPDNESTIEMKEIQKEYDDCLYRIKKEASDSKRFF